LETLAYSCVELTDTDSECGNCYTGDHVLEDVGPSSADESCRLPIVGVVVGGTLEAWEGQVRGALKRPEAYMDALRRGEGCIVDDVWLIS